LTVAGTRVHSLAMPAKRILVTGGSGTAEHWIERDGLGCEPLIEALISNRRAHELLGYEQFFLQ